MNGDRPRISVVMPVRNEEEWLERAVCSVQAQTYPSACIEIIVVVGPSTDRTREIAEKLRENDPRLRIVDNPGGRTPTALNLGIGAARGELIARVDGHGWIEPDYLENGVEALERSSAAGVGGVVHFFGLTRIGRAIALAEQSAIGTGGAAFRVARAETDADGLRWGLFRKSLFDEVGLFDESLERNQDDEFCYRVVSAGGRLVVTPSMRLHQVVRSSLPALWRQYSQWGQFRVATLAKHRRPATIRQAAPPLLVALLALTLVAEPASRGRVRLGRRFATAYASTIVVLGSTHAARSRQADVMLLVPPAIVTMHLAYGYGFWVAFARRLAVRAAGGHAVNGA